MITTDFVPGSPCWLDLGAADPEAAVRFYSAVFGWEADRGTEGYTILRRGDRAVAAVGVLTEEGARPAWVVYYATEDADAAAAAVEKAGGTVRARPFDAGDAGRIAQLSDPQGGEFAVWQAGTMAGLEDTDGPDSFGWAELWTPDAAGARAFYESVFGWWYTDTPMPDGEGGGATYTMVTPEGQPAERMHGGMMQVGAEQLAGSGGKADWHPVFYVADCDASAARVTGSGGRLLMGSEDVPGVGRLAVCADPEGAGFVLLAPSPD
ncbi:VOC family protein [Nocardiopsis sp. CNT-189]|uniref:VOC family protein n=1 Tax=Nocardiopsis oceanisediminis TaxID=2816862 RepID=UPI003B368F1A